jgi:hypothetical protein
MHKGKIAFIWGSAAGSRKEKKTTRDENKHAQVEQFTDASAIRISQAANY